jgi:hypothetical protein
MSENQLRTRRYVLAERPAAPVGPLQEGVLRYQEDVPVPPPEAGQVLVKVEWMSLDPATRSWMNDIPGSLPPSPLGETMRALGAGTASSDPESRQPWQPAPNSRSATPSKASVSPPP